MKRDMELVRLLLIEAEGEEHLDLSGYTDEQLGYHWGLLIDDVKWIAGHTAKDETDQTVAWSSTGLTWEGHEFLDNIRTEGVWKRIGATVKKQGSGLSFAVLKGLAVKFALEAAMG